MSGRRPHAAPWGTLHVLRTMPEIRLLMPGFGLSLVWEVLQSPFYADTLAAPWTMVALNRLHCAGGDALLLLVAFWLVAWRWGRAWMETTSGTPLTAFLTLGIAYTAYSEHINVQVDQRWAYSRWMPTLAGLGLVPLLQWVVIPLASVHRARRVKAMVTMQHLVQGDSDDA